MVDITKLFVEFRILTVANDAQWHHAQEMASTRFYGRPTIPFDRVHYGVEHLKYSSAMYTVVVGLLLR
jgi:hypothetical protein